MAAPKRTREDLVHWGRAVKPPDKITVSEWADRHRVLPDWAQSSGRWHTERTPYLREIMDAIADREVESVTFCKPTQVGGTEALLNMLGYVMDQDPGPAMLVMPTEVDLKYMVEQRLVPMIEASETLRAQLTERAHDVKKGGINLRRMPLYFVSAGSSTGLRSRPVRYLFMDEPDGFPGSAGDEGAPSDLADERTRTYWNRKKVRTSTPTVKTGEIWQNLQASDWRRYWVPCPHCHAFQVLNFKGGVRWPEDERDPAKIRTLRLASYGCARCGAVIADESKPAMLRAGVWAPKGCEVKPSGAIVGTPERAGGHRGYHLSALYSPWLTWSEVAAKFLEAEQSGDRNKLCVFINCWLAEPWEDVIEEIREDRLDRLVLPYARDAVPEGAVTLTAGIDVQKGFMAYVIRAWGQNEASWLVRAARTDTWEAVVREVLEATYGGLQVQLCCVDANYRTDEVYDFCRQWRDVCRPTIGRATIAGLPYTMSKVDRNPEGGELPAHLVTMRFLVNTEFFKDRLSRYMTEEPPRFRIHQEPQAQYLREVTAEHKVLERAGKRGEMRQVWRKKPGHRDNHFFDTEVLALVAAHMVGALDLRVRAIAGPERQPPKPAAAPAQGAPTSQRQRFGSRWGRGRWS